MPFLRPRPGPLPFRLGGGGGFLLEGAGCGGLGSGTLGAEMMVVERQEAKERRETQLTNAVHISGLLEGNKDPLLGVAGISLSVVTLTV